MQQECLTMFDSIGFLIILLILAIFWFLGIFIDRGDK